MRVRLWMLVLGVVLGCSGGEAGGGPSREPEPDPDPPEVLPPAALVIGDTISGWIDSTATATWLHVAQAEEELAFFFAVDSGVGGLQALVVQSANARVVYSFDYDPKPLLETRTDRMTIRAGDSLHVRVTPAGGPGLRYRFLAYRVTRRPENSPEAYEPDSLRVSERLENSADIDEFIITSSSPLELVGFLRTPEASVTGTAALYVDLQSSDAVAAVPGSGSIEDAATRTVAVPAGSWRIRVSGVSGPPQPYEFIVRRVRRAPESAPPDVAAGRSTFGEVIEHIGDVDEYTISGPPGDYTNLHLTASPAGGRQLQVTTQGEGVVSRTASLSVGRTSASTGRVMFPASGQVRLVVGGQYPSAEVVGPYEVTQDLLSPAPENGSSLVPGDSVIAESIEREGDVDTFPFTLAAPASLNFFMRRTTGTPGGLQFEVWPVGDTASALRLLLGPTSPNLGTGVRWLGAGSYVARVLGGDGDDGPSPFTGAYRLHAYRIDSAPEMASASAIIGSVLQEAIDPPGDRDTFALAGQAGDVFRLRFVSPAQGTPSPIAASILNRTPGAAPPWLGAAGTPVVFAYQGPGAPIEMGVDGPHRIEVKSVAEGLLVADPEGAYTLAIDPVSVLPESNPASIGVNATVSESLESADIDEYTIAGTAGQEVAVYLSGSMQYTRPEFLTALCAEFMDPGSVSRRGGIDATPNGEGSGPLVLGASGNLRVRVWSTQACPTLPSARIGSVNEGSYSLVVRAVNPEPESAPALVAVGDTVRQESIEHGADLDTFTFTGTAGQEIVPSLWLAAQPSMGQLDLQLTVTAPGGGVVTEHRSHGMTDTWRRGDPVVLPATGTYTVKVMTHSRRAGSGAYMFTLWP